MHVNVTIQTFKTENELERSVMRWDKIKSELRPKFKEMGLVRYKTRRILSDQKKFQLSQIFEYEDNESAKNCIPIWGEIERKWSEKIENTTTSYRGKMMDRFDFEEK